MAYFMIGLAIFAPVLCLISMKQLAHFLMELIDAVGSKPFQWISNILIIPPLLVITIVVLFYFSFWRTNPMLRFTHMIWVLSLWISGTLGLFIFVIPVRVKLAFPYLALIASFLSISMAIYFTPLPNFQTIFMDPKKLFFSLVIGVVDISMSWMIAYRIRLIHNLNVPEKNWR